MTTTGSITSEERISRVKELLTSSLRSSRIGNKICKSRPRNAMLGVVFHACARFEQGLPLSDLEQTIIDSLSKVLSDDELREHGRSYKAMSPDNRTAMFPDNIASRSIESSYTKKEFSEDLRTKIVPELLAQPNVRIVDPKEIASGAVPNPEEDESYLSAMKEYSHGITIYHSPSTDGAERSTMSVKITLDRFKCTDESNELSDSDEIFWGTAASSDTGGKKTYRSKVFNDVDDGITFEFPTDPAPILFEGTLDQALVCSIECWEEDQGSGWSEISSAMLDIADKCQEAAENLSDDDETELAAAIAIVAFFVTTILGAIFASFEDDLIKQRDFAWNQEALNKFKSQAQGEGPWTFNGGGSEGCHLLYIRYK